MWHTAPGFYLLIDFPLPLQILVRMAGFDLGFAAEQVVDQPHIELKHQDLVQIQPGYFIHLSLTYQQLALRFQLI